MLFHRIDQVHDSFHVVKKIRNIHDVVVAQPFFSDQVYCARGTVPKLHIKATSKEEEGTGPE